MRPRGTLKQYFALVLLSVLGFVVTSCLSTMFDQPPVAKITVAAGNPYGAVPLEITFDISGSSDPDGEIVSFTVDFGDNSSPIYGSDLTESIVHTYSQPGTFFARVEVTDNKGKTSRSPGLLIAPK